MTMEENIRVLIDIASLEPELRSMQLDIFHEVEKLLQGDEAGVSCTWRACDPYTTSAVRGVEGMGQKSNCGRTNKDGIDFVKADKPGHERYIGLYHTPQEQGGCKGCRFFLFCKGQCPGTAIDGDWRNRTEHCEIWMQLFERAERKLLDRGIQPLSIRPERLPMERNLLQEWAHGRNPRLAELPRQTTMSRRFALRKRRQPFSPGSNPRAATNPRARGISRARCRSWDFSMPPFRRIAWASDAAKRAWEPVSRRDRPGTAPPLRLRHSCWDSIGALWSESLPRTSKTSAHFSATPWGWWWASLRKAKSRGNASLAALRT